jgi:hypothetical protein
MRDGGSRREKETARERVCGEQRGIERLGEREKE